MLSDEEKKEYEELKILLYTGTISQYGKGKLIDMFEKQIKELGQENREIREWKYVIDNPIDLEKLKELDLIKIKGKEYISKDKIKAKIEEYKEMTVNLVNRSAGKTFQQAVRNEVIKVLQSLLEN